MVVSVNKNAFKLQLVIQGVLCNERFMNSMNIYSSTYKIINSAHLPLQTAYLGLKKKIKNINIRIKVECKEFMSSYFFQFSILIHILT